MALDCDLSSRAVVDVIECKMNKDKYRIRHNMFREDHQTSTYRIVGLKKFYRHRFFMGNLGLKFSGGYSFALGGLRYVIVT